ncbi:type-F conjugative transfer system protein TrbI [Enterobacter asburiae]|uniref:type-F conjugative transfer system protein TrbI n=1 Tax=Enterobacter TaxID=547 RepID=UPI0018C2DA3B|nr:MULTISPECIES: type-F conjugative transfer system protein TrbI [Enterobacter]MBG0640594.1 type-F conjugative transfer system protein TrbI [Enterobacter asburiae]MCK7310560.1 type-F conjugative transfer system protein TrbI [Enterobacter quasiroggenkampii]
MGNTALTTGQSADDVTSGNPQLTRRQKAKRQCLRNLGLVVLAVTALNAAVTSAMISWRAPVIVSFDMKSTIDRFTEQATGRELKEGELEALTSRFTFSLNNALTDYQQRHSALILVKPAVVSGVPDITTEIQGDISQRMTEWTR